MAISQRQWADMYQVSPHTIRRLLSDGVDLEDRKSVTTFILNMRQRPKAWVNGSPLNQPVGSDRRDDVDPAEVIESLDEDSLNESLEALTRKALAATEYDTVRTLKTKVETLEKVRKVQILERDYIHREEIASDHTKIGAAMRTALERLKADLPSQLEGLSARDMKNVIADKAREILLQLSDDLSELYQDTVL